MLKKRIISTLIIKNEIVVQSIGFEKYLPIGSPIISVEFLNNWGVDEIIILDISASKLNIPPNFNLVKLISSKCNVPLTIGGGIKELDDIKNLVNLGADKVSLNNILFHNPKIISDAARIFGNQCIVPSIDIKKIGTNYFIYNYFTKKCIATNYIDHIKMLMDLGAGELFINSVDRDGKYNGYDIELFNNLTEKIKIPIIASGGAKNAKDFIEIFEKTKITAVSASNLFHFTEHSVNIIKSILSESQEIRFDSKVKYNQFKFDQNMRPTKLEDKILEKLLYQKIEKEII